MVLLAGTMPPLAATPTGLVSTSAVRSSAEATTKSTLLLDKTPSG